MFALSCQLWNSLGGSNGRLRPFGRDDSNGFTDLFPLEQYSSV